jgi:hypothetical protein
MTGSMDDHAAPPTRPYPPPAVGLERNMLKVAAATGILLIACAIAAMGIGMYFLPGAPPNLPLPGF